MGKGYLIINVGADTIAQPVTGADVHIMGDGTDIHVETDISGNTPEVELDCPDKEYSLSPQREVRPYAVYSVEVHKQGLQPKRINGIQILDGTHAVDNIVLQSEPEEDPPMEIIDIPDHTLWGNFPPKIVVDPDTQQLLPDDHGTLPEPIVPEYIIVHDGLPTNTDAARYYVSYADYIKNVASSEIYSTWPVETLRANILAILSFTSNRIFTEWYRGKGFTFTITSSTQFDQKFIPGRNIFTEISNVVDDIFTQFLRFPGHIQPFFAQYNDGIQVNNAGWLSQWGSKDLGERGYSAIDILRYYYGNTIYIATAEIVEGIPYSFPGYNLEMGICGDAVQTMQSQLNVISGSFPAIPKIYPADGVFGAPTKTAVEAFQRIFNLPITGVVDFSTWFNISHIFVSVSRMLRGRYDY